MAAKSQKYEAIVMGASAGAMDALTQILPNLAQDFPLPIMIVVHLPGDKKSILAELFHAKCALEVVEAQDKEPIETGKIYFAPPDYHLLVEKGKYLSLSSEEPILFSRPSIDALFETAAAAYGKALIGIILTGANEDGAEGLRTIVGAGGKALIQNPELAYAKMMPLSAKKKCPKAAIMTLPEITQYLQELNYA